MLRFQRVAFGEVVIDLLYDSCNVRSVWNLNLAECFSCKKLSVWRYDKMLYPQITHSHTPNADLPEDIRNDFLEASAILSLSPRGSAALLRLCVQKLCRHLGEKGKNINDDIRSLVEKGLDETTQQALDVVRVVGNDAVHPGLIDLRDDPDVANKLFMLVNHIAEMMITRPKTINEIYQLIPPEKQADIAKRDGRPKQPT